MGEVSEKRKSAAYRESAAALSKGKAPAEYLFPLIIVRLLNYLVT
jgi:hypothetical protein